MPVLIDPDVEGRVRALNSLKYSSYMIVRTLKKRGINISQTAVINIVNNVGQRRQAKAAAEMFKHKKPRPTRTKSLIKLVELACQKENPPTHKSLAHRLSCSRGTIYNVIHLDLGLTTRKKTRVHRLTSRQKAQRVAACKSLLANAITPANLEICVTERGLALCTRL